MNPPGPPSAYPEGRLISPLAGYSNKVSGHHNHITYQMAYCTRNGRLFVPGRGRHIRHGHVLTSDRPVVGLLAQSRPPHRTIPLDAESPTYSPPPTHILSTRTRSSCSDLTTNAPPTDRLQFERQRAHGAKGGSGARAIEKWTWTGVGGCLIQSAKVGICPAARRPSGGRYPEGGRHI